MLGHDIYKMEDFGNIIDKLTKVFIYRRYPLDTFVNNTFHIFYLKKRPSQGKSKTFLFLLTDALLNDAVIYFPLHIPFSWLLGHPFSDRFIKAG